MSLINKKKIDFEFEDNRGYLKQLSHENYGQINVLFTKQGVERGNHFHKLCTESFYVIDGSVRVHVEKDGLSENEKFLSGDFFQIKPEIMHSMIFDEDCLMIAMYDKCVELKDGSKDIYTEMDAK